VKTIRRIAAGLALATAAITGILTAVDDLATPADTTGGAPTLTPSTPDTVDLPDVTILDTTWG
jgi:hypothetical protein